MSIEAFSDADDMVARLQAATSHSGPSLSWDGARSILFRVLHLMAERKEGKAASKSANVTSILLLLFDFFQVVAVLASPEFGYTFDIFGWMSSLSIARALDIELVGIGWSMAFWGFSTLILVLALSNAALVGWQVGSGGHTGSLLPLRTLRAFVTLALTALYVPLVQSTARFLSCERMVSKAAAAGGAAPACWGVTHGLLFGTSVFVLALFIPFALIVRGIFFDDAPTGGSVVAKPIARTATLDTACRTTVVLVGLFLSPGNRLGVLLVVSVLYMSLLMLTVHYLPFYRRGMTMLRVGQVCLYGWLAVGAFALEACRRQGVAEASLEQLATVLLVGMPLAGLCGALIALRRHQWMRHAAVVASERAIRSAVTAARGNNQPSTLLEGTTTGVYPGASARTAAPVAKLAPGSSHLSLTAARSSGDSSALGSEVTPTHSAEHHVDFFPGPSDEMASPTVGDGSRAKQLGAPVTSSDTAEPQQKGTISGNAHTVPTGRESKGCAPASQIAEASQGGLGALSQAAAGQGDRLLSDGSDCGQEHGKHAALASGERSRAMPKAASRRIKSPMVIKAVVAPASLGSPTQATPGAPFAPAQQERASVEFLAAVRSSMGPRAASAALQAAAPATMADPLPGHDASLRQGVEHGRTAHRLELSLGGTMRVDASALLPGRDAERSSGSEEKEPPLPQLDQDGFLDAELITKPEAGSLAGHASRFFSSETDVELMVRALLRRPTPRRVFYAKALLEEALVVYPDSVYCRIVYATFLFNWASNEETLRAVRLLVDAARLPAALDLQYTLYARITGVLELRRKMQIGTSGADVDSIGLIEFKKQFRNAERQHLAAVKGLAAWWGAVASGSVDGETMRGVSVSDRLESIASASSSAERTYLGLMERYPRAKALARAYGIFLVNARVDETGTAYTRAGEDVDDGMMSGVGSISGMSGSGPSTATSSRLSSADAARRRQQRLSARLNLDIPVVTTTTRGFRLALVGLVLALAVIFASTAFVFSTIRLNIETMDAAGLRRKLTESAWYGARGLQLLAAQGDAAGFASLQAHVLKEMATLGAKHSFLFYSGRRFEAIDRVWSSKTSVTFVRYNPDVPVGRRRWEQSMSLWDAGNLFVATTSRLARQNMSQFASATTMPEWRFVMDNAPVRMLGAFENAVGVYQAEDEQLVAEQAAVQASMLGCKVVILSLLAGCVFWPAVRSVHEGKSSLRVLVASLPRRLGKHMARRYRRVERALTELDQAGMTLEDVDPTSQRYKALKSHDFLLRIQSKPRPSPTANAMARRIQATGAPVEDDSALSSVGHSSVGSSDASDLSGSEMAEDAGSGLVVAGRGDPGPPEGSDRRLAWKRSGTDVVSGRSASRRRRDHHASPPGMRPKEAEAAGGGAGAGQPSAPAPPASGGDGLEALMRVPSGADGGGDDDEQSAALLVSDGDVLDAVHDAEELSELVRQRQDALKRGATLKDVMQADLGLAGESAGPHDDDDDDSDDEVVRPVDEVTAEDLTSPLSARPGESPAFGSGDGAAVEAPTAAMDRPAALSGLEASPSGGGERHPSPNSVSSLEQADVTDGSDNGIAPIDPPSATGLAGDSQPDSRGADHPPRPASRDRSGRMAKGRSKRRTTSSRRHGRGGAVKQRPGHAMVDDTKANAGSRGVRWSPQHEVRVLGQPAAAGPAGGERRRSGSLLLPPPPPPADRPDSPRDGPGSCGWRVCRCCRRAPRKARRNSIGEVDTATPTTLASVLHDKQLRSVTLQTAAVMLLLVAAQFANFFLTLDISRSGSAKPAELNSAGRRRYLARETLNTARELLVGDGEVGTVPELGARLQRYSAFYRRVHDGLRHGDAGLGLPGSERRYPALEALMYAQSGDGFAAAPIASLREPGAEIPKDALAAYGVDPLFRLYMTTIDELHQQFSNATEPRPGLDWGAMLRNPKLKLAFDLERGPVGSGFGKAVKLYKSEGLVEVSTLESLQSGLVGLELVLVLLVYSVVHRIVRQALRREYTRSLDIQAMVPPSIASSDPTLAKWRHAVRHHGIDSDGKRRGKGSKSSKARTRRGSVTRDQR